jgi:hypothetical protein
MKGAGVGGISKASGGFFFVWTLLALGVTGVLSVILSAHGLWGLRRKTKRTTTSADALTTWFSQTSEILATVSS